MAIFVVAPFIIAACRTPAVGGASSSTRADNRDMAAVTNELLEADRKWSQLAAGARFPQALAPMFAPTVRMPSRDRVLTGAANVLAAFAATPDTNGTVRWIPIRAGVAADGQQGFTAGVQLITRANGTTGAARYLAYWTRDAAGAGGTPAWRVVAWRRRPLADVVPDTTPLPPVVPGFTARATSNASVLAQHYTTLVNAEQEFSDHANRIGVGAAFAERGDAEALNMGRPDGASFARGAAAIAALVSGGQSPSAPSAITWNADTAIVASSGDLGITFGIIRPKVAPPGPGGNAGATGAAFFTIWRKSSRSAPWRYIAE